MPETSLGGARYMLTVIDEYTDYHWAWSIRAKSDAAGVLKGWILQVERQSGHRVVTIRSDNGGEYLSTEFVSWLRSLGIRQQTTIADTPQQNGKAERANRTIEEKITALLLESGLPGAYWAEAMTYALYVLARTVRKSTGRTRHDDWFGSPPSFDRLRVFGCTAYAHNPKHKKHQSKSVPCWFMCPAEDAVGKKAYRLVDKRNPHKVVFSRDVVFDEGWTMRTKGSASSGSGQTATMTPLTSRMPLGLDLPSSPSGPAEIEDTAGVDMEEENRTGTDVETVGPKTDDESGAGVLSEDELREEEEEEELAPLPAVPRFFVASNPSLTTTRRTSGRKTQLPARFRGPNQANVLISLGQRPPPAAPPKTYKEAVSGLYRAEWEAAMKAELDQFEKLDVWTLRPVRASSPPPPVISGRWVYTCGPTSDPEMTKFKARWVARGYEQREGTFGDTYSPVADGTSRRPFFQLSPTRASRSAKATSRQPSSTPNSRSQI